MAPISNLHQSSRIDLAPRASRIGEIRAPVRIGVAAPPRRRGASLWIVRAGDANQPPQKVAVQSSNYVVPIDKSSCITRPLAEILRDLNKRVPENIVRAPHENLIPWYHANRMLSFYAPGWCGEVRDVIFSNNGGVTVVYRLTVRGSDGEAHREATGTVSSKDAQIADPVTAAEEIAFCKACARFGLGLYLYHEE